MQDSQETLAILQLQYQLQSVHTLDTGSTVSPQFSQSCDNIRASPTGVQTLARRLASRLLRNKYGLSSVETAPPPAVEASWCCPAAPHHQGERQQQYALEGPTSQSGL